MRKLLILVLLLSTSQSFAQNYQATQGVGTTFGTKLVSAVNYPQIVFCDPATPSQCVAVNASGQLTIANTSFAATQSGTWNINNITGTVSLPTGAATSTNQPTNATIASTTSGQTGNLHMGAVTTAAPTYTTGQTDPFSLTTAGALRVDASSTTQPVSGTVTVQQSTAANLNMTCANCSGSGASGTDEAAFTAGASVFAPSGGFFQTTPTANPLTTGQWGVWQMTANRAGFVNLRNGSGTEIGTSSTPIQVSVANTGANGTAMLVTGTGGVFPATQSGTWTVNPTTAANWGIGSSTQNSSTVANGELVLGQFNTTPTTITSGNMSPLQMDNAGNLLVNIKAGSSSGAVAQGSTTSGQTGGLIQAAATTSAPTYTTATTNPLSMDTSGNLRVTVASAVGLAQGSTTSGQTGSLIMGAVTTAAPTYTTAQTSPLSLDTAGNLRVNVVAGGGTGGTSSSFAAAFPGTGTATGVESSGNMVGLIQADNSTAINVSTATTTQLVALSAGKKIYVSSFDVVAGGTGNITFEYGTGTACATGTTALTGPYNLTAQSGIAKGNGLGMVLVVPAGNALCVLTSAAVQMSGSIAYTQF